MYDFLGNTMAHPPLRLLLTLLPWPLSLSRGSGGEYLTVVRGKSAVKAPLLSVFLGLPIPSSQGGR